MDGVFLTEAERPVGMLVTISGVDAVAFGVVCAGIAIDSGVAGIVEIVVGV